MTKRRVLKVILILALVAAFIVPASLQAAPTTLKPGSSGNEVLVMQIRLQDLGFYPYPVTGSYGELTSTAVKTFQQANGLTADGICGALTQQKLYSANAVRRPFTPPAA